MYYTFFYYSRKCSMMQVAKEHWLFMGNRNLRSILTFLLSLIFRIKMNMIFFIENLWISIVLNQRKNICMYLMYLYYDDSESPILHNSNLFHAIQNSFQTIPNFFHATRNSFRATPNMFPLIVHLVCNICKNNFHHPIWSWNLRILLHVPAKLNKKQINSMNVCSGRKWL